MFEAGKEELAMQTKTAQELGLTVPMVHLNGTGRERLVEAYGEAGAAVRKATEALRDASPNGRDYYPLGDDALRKAEAEHRSRMERLQSVWLELGALAVAIDEAGR